MGIAPWPYGCYGSWLRPPTYILFLTFYNLSGVPAGAGGLLNAYSSSATYDQCFYVLYSYSHALLEGWAFEFSQLLWRWHAVAIGDQALESGCLDYLRFQFSESLDGSRSCISDYQSFVI